MTLRGGKGLAYQIQSSMDLVNWADGETQTNVSGVLLFQFPTNSIRRFFRALEFE
jgi:hypothetical protein